MTTQRLTKMFHQAAGQDHFTLTPAEWNSPEANRTGPSIVGNGDEDDDLDRRIQADLDSLGRGYRLRRRAREIGRLALAAALGFLLGVLCSEFRL